MRSALMAMALSVVSVLTAVGAVEGWHEPLASGDLSAFSEPRGEWEVAGGAAMDPQNNRVLSATSGTGVMVNGKTGRTVDLLTREEFGDVEAHVEFMVPAGSNSGVYFMGRYEVQILDSFGKASVGFGDCGGIYQGGPFKGSPPHVNASRPPGEWQTYDVVFLAPRFDAAGKKIAPARFVRVTHNGVVVQENVDVPQPTVAAHFGDEKASGPLMVQGDHGPVAYRNIRIRPLKPCAANAFFAMDTSFWANRGRAKTGLDESLDLAKELGYAGVSWNIEDPDVLGKVLGGLKSRGLNLYAVYAPATLEKDKVVFDERLDAVMDLLKGSGAMIWLTLRGKAFPAGSEEGDPAAVASLRELASRADGRGLRVAIYPHRGDWIEKTADAIRVAKKVGQPNLGVTFNFCHALMSGEEAKIPDLLREAGPQLFLVTLNGADTGAAGTSWGRLIQPLDAGSYDVGGLLRQLDKVNYRGAIGLQAYDVPLDARTHLARSMKGWRKLTGGEPVSPAP
jgi:sugar phosphate isomerase/epimerase